MPCVLDCICIKIMRDKQIPGFFKKIILVPDKIDVIGYEELLKIRGYEMNAANITVNLNVRFRFFMGILFKIL